MARPPSTRQARVASLLREVVAELITFEVKDPRVRGVVVTDVEVSGDLREAKVFVAGLSEGEQREQAMHALGRAAGFMRREVGQRVRMRSTPALRFFYDESLEYGARIEAKLKELGLGESGGDEDDGPAT